MVLPSKMLSFFLTTFLFIIHLSPTTSQMVDSDQGLEGQWRLLHNSIGISAMHMQLLHNNRVVMFDRTDFGPSNLSLPHGRCRFDPNERVLKMDCTAHSTLYDIKTNELRALTVQTDTWCSSGAVVPNGTLVQTGGFNDGDHVIRTLAACGGDKCDWIEFRGYLSRRRWYASNQILPDGRVIIVGGRGQFSYEFYPKTNNVQSRFVLLSFLQETSDQYENNLYPFLHLLPDGNLFIFANTRSVVLDYKVNRIIREFPIIPGGDPRNYPSSGSSLLLPLDENSPIINVEVMICGGASRNAVGRAIQGTFQRAISTCGRIKLNDQEPAWTMENMPMPRVMGDMLLLPDGNVLIINGAGSGTAGWEAARNPVTRPVIYKPNCQTGNKFSVMAPAGRPRLYHSTAVLIPDGRVLVGGSNPHIYYNFTGVEYPTDLSLESFSPPYMSVLYDPLRPSNIEFESYELNNVLTIGYNTPFSLTFTVQRFMKLGVVSVRIVAPSFNTHSFSMNQRMVVLKGVVVSWVSGDVYRVVAAGPHTAEIAPPGYYLLFVVHSGVPGSGKWVKIE